MSILKRFYSLQDSEATFEKADGSRGSIRLSSQALITPVAAFCLLFCSNTRLLRSPVVPKTSSSSETPFRFVAISSTKSIRLEPQRRAKTVNCCSASLPFRLNLSGTRPTNQTDGAIERCRHHRSSIFDRRSRTNTRAARFLTCAVCCIREGSSSARHPRGRISLWDTDTRPC